MSIVNETFPMLFFTYFIDTFSDLHKVVLLTARPSSPSINLFSIINSVFLLCCVIFLFCPCYYNLSDKRNTYKRLTLRTQHQSLTDECYDCFIMAVACVSKIVPS